MLNSDWLANFWQYSPTLIISQLGKVCCKLDVTLPRGQAGLLGPVEYMHEVQEVQTHV